jgi:2-polyprenyl-3-methyl-5-hydroxy-6-metoxy-1,4-benzoquinol methylase
MKATKSYFDMHSHHHAYHKDPNFYIPIINHIKRIKTYDKIRILDVGCGDGTFINSMIRAGINAFFLGSDISSAMVTTAKEKVNHQGVDLLVADGFRLPIKPEIKFDVIHIDRVLHHLTGKTISNSIELANQMIELLIKRLSINGLLVVEEKTPHS